MIHIISLETSNFSFLAIGQGKEAATTALIEGVAVHLQQCNLDGSAESLIADYGAGEYAPLAGMVERPVCFRDQCIIWQG